MSFIIACIMLFVIGGILLKDEVDFRIYEAEVEDHEKIENDWKRRALDRELEKRLERYEDSGFPDKERTEDISFLKEVESLKLTRSSLYLISTYSGSFIPCKFGIMLLMAKRGKVPFWINEFGITAREIDTDPQKAFAFLKFYEKLLRDNGLPDTEIIYIGSPKFTHSRRHPTKVVSVEYDTTGLDGNFEFNQMTAYELGKNGAIRLW